MSRILSVIIMPDWLKEGYIDIKLKVHKDGKNLQRVWFPFKGSRAAKYLLLVKRKIGKVWDHHHIYSISYSIPRTIRCCHTNPFLTTQNSKRRRVQDIFVVRCCFLLLSWRGPPNCLNWTKSHLVVGNAINLHLLLLPLLITTAATPSNRLTRLRSILFVYTDRWVLILFQYVSSFP